MKIETLQYDKEPKCTGRFVCFVDCDQVPTLVRVFLPGTGWLSNLREPIAGKITAWIGPLPMIERRATKPIAQEFDL